MILALVVIGGGPASQPMRHIRVENHDYASIIHLQGICITKYTPLTDLEEILFMGGEFIGVESAPYSPRRFPLLEDHINRQSKGLLVEVLESEVPKFWKGTNRMDPRAFGSPMATLAGEWSKSEGTLSSLQNSSSSVRFGASAGSSSLSSTDAGYVNRTVSVSELLAFHNKDGKASDKQTPIVCKDSMPVTSSFPTLNFSSGVTTINSSTIPATSNISPSAASSGLSLLVDGRKSSASASKDSKDATCCVSANTTGLTPSTSSSSFAHFVFSAGASDIGPLKPGTQTNVFSGHFFSGLRPASQFNDSTDGLFSGKSRPGVQPDVPSDNSLLGPMRVACPPNASNDASFLGSPEPSVQLNVLKGNLFSVPLGPAAPVSCSTGPSLVDSSKPSSQAKVQATGFIDPTRQSAISLQELFGCNAAQDRVGGLSNCTMQRNTFAEIDQGSSADISLKLNQLDIDRGIDLFRKLKNLGLDKNVEKIVKPTTSAPETEVERALGNLDIGKEDSLPLKMEKLAVNIEGKDPFPEKNTFVFRGQSPRMSGDWTPSSAACFFGAASARVDNFSECTENEHSKSPPATNISFFKFGSEPEVKPRVTKVKMGRFQHRPFRSFHRSRGRKSAFTTSSERSEAATPSPSRVSVSKDIHLDYPGFSKSPIPENNEGDSDKPIGRAFGGESMNSMSELEACIQEIRAAVSELNFGAGFSRENEISSTVPFSKVLERNSWLDGNLYREGVSNSAAQGWEALSTANSQSVDRAELENYLVEQGDPMNEFNDREDEVIVIAKNSVAGRNEDDTENSSGPQSFNVTDDGQPSAEGEGKCSPFTFTASPTGIPMSNLRRRTHKAHKSVGRVSHGGEAPVPVLLRDRCNSRSMSTVKSDTRSATASLGGLVGSDHREGVKAPGVVVFRGVVAGAAEQVCERWRLRGNQAYAKGDFVKAEEFYSLGAGSVSPHETSQSCIRASMLCYSNRAATRMVAGRMREALADCMYAMAVDPSFFRVHLRAAGCHLALGETELAATAFEECLRQAQGASKVDSKVLADASEGLKKSQQVAECLTQVRNLLQNNSSRDLVSALQLLNEALLSSPQSEWLLERKAYMLISLQRFPEAVELCKVSSALAERNFPTLERNRYMNSPLGWRRRMTVKANFHLGKLEEALEQLQQLEEGPFTFSSNSDLPGAFSAEMTLPSTELIRDLLHHKLEGNKAFQAGNFTEALDHYNAALARSGESRPFCAVCLCNRAAASQALGQIADAIADCSRAIALDPRYAKAISRRASLHEKVRDYGQCICDLGRLIVIYESQHPQLQGVRSPRVDGLAGSAIGNEEELQQAKGRLMKAEEEMKKRIPLDHYSILGLELGCSASEIKKAYRKAALRHHPDKAGQFLMRSGDTGDDLLKDSIDGTVRKDGERLIDAVRKDSEQLFKLIGEAYAVLSDPAKRSRYDSEEDSRKFRTRSNDPSKNVYSDQNHSRTNDGSNVQAKGGWSTSSSASEPGSQSRASRQRDRWEGFSYQYQRWHPGPDAAQPDVYARRGRSTGPTYGSSYRTTSWRWEENPWDDV